MTTLGIQSQLNGALDWCLDKFSFSLFFFFASVHTFLCSTIKNIYVRSKTDILLGKHPIDCAAGMFVFLFRGMENLLCTVVFSGSFERRMGMWGYWFSYVVNTN
jgi:uncharacterized membrane protein YcgQ (UPF0703/DUF1980 family)